MKNATVNFAKSYKTHIVITNFLIILLGIFITMRITRHWLVLSSFPWITIVLVLLDIWISFCILSSGIIDGVKLSYRRVLADIFMLVIVFYNLVHVFLSMFFSYKLHISWYFFYGVYHFIFALAVFIIFKNYKNKKIARSALALKEASYFILALAITFSIIMHFVLRDNERLNVSNRALIYSFAALTLVNLVLSLYFVVKMKKTKNTNFIAHKYINLASAIISLFFVQTIYINEFCEIISLHTMQRLTMTLGVPCFIALIFLAQRLWKKAKIMEMNKKV